MAITNAQQFKQLVNPPMKGKKRPGYRGEAAAASDRAGGRNAGRDTSPAGTGNVGGDFDRGSFQAAQRMGEARQIAKNLAEDKAFEQQGFETLRARDSNFPGFIGMGLNLLKGPRQKLLDRNIDFFRNDPRTRKAREKYGLTAQGYKDYMSARLAGKIDAAGNPIDDEDDDNNIILPQTMFAQAPSITEKEEEEEETFTPNFRLLAEGGRIGAQEGGIMPRLNQLGSGVSSAEQMLQDINQRLESAESSLGGGGVEQLQAVQPGSNNLFAGRPVTELQGQPMKIDPPTFMRPGNIPGTDVPFSTLRGGVPAAAYANGGNVILLSSSSSSIGLPYASILPAILFFI